MPTLTNEKLIKYLAITVTVAACMHRLSTAVFSIANGLAFLLVLYLWRQNKYSLNLSDEAKGYMKAYIIFILFMIPSVFVSDKPLVSLKDYLNFVVWRYGNIIFIAIMAFIKQRDYLVNMLTALLLTTIGDCMLAVGQVTLHINPHRSRGWGLGGNSLYLSGILCMVLPVALAIALDPAFEKRLKKVASCAVAAITAGLIFNNSRSAWLTEVLVIPPTIYKYVKQQKKYLLAVVLVLAGIAAFMAAKPVYMARIRTIPATVTNWSQDARGVMWKHAVSIIEDYPVAGVGLGRSAEKYQELQSKTIEAIKKQTQQVKAATKKQPSKKKAAIKKQTQQAKADAKKQPSKKKAAIKKQTQQVKAAAKKQPNQPKKARRKRPKLLTHAHNNFLQVAAETGLVGLAGFVYFCGYVLFTSLKNYRKHHNPCDKLIFLVFLSNVVLMGLFDVTFFMSPGMSFMVFLIAVLLQMKTAKKTDNL